MKAPSDLLVVENLETRFTGKNGAVIRAVDGVNLTQKRGETIGIVGESGCGKSTLARSILRIIEPSTGRILFDGEDLRALSPRALRARRRDMQLVFQDPYASLDPRFMAGTSIEEPLIVHGMGTASERKVRVRELLETVGLDADAARRYPHEFSGGQRQRIGIARAIALSPKLVIADEPVSALDVSIQSQILNLLIDLKSKMSLSYLFISHDLAVIRVVSDTIAVMYLGRIVEHGGAAEIFQSPAHPYTQALLSAVPVPDPARKRSRIVLHGEPSSPETPVTGCPFHSRCPKAMEDCASIVPVTTAVSSGHTVACHLYD